MLRVCSLHVFMYSNKTMIWKRSRIRAVQMGNLRALLGIRRINKVPNTQIGEMSEKMKRVDERIGKSVLQRFSYVKRMENDRIAKSLWCLFLCMVMKQ